MTEISADEWRSLSSCLGEALEVEEPARSAWLDALRLRDPAMAEQVANALACRQDAGFAGFLADSGPLLAEPASVDVDLAGRAIGPYVLEAEIGRGGMGSVWRARRADGRYAGFVAIKFLHALWSGGAAQRYFRAEGNLLGRLDHPHIARLLDAGVLDGVHPYLILEYAEGEPIDDYSNRHGLDVEARVRLFVDVLDAVAHAHSHLIVHRDIKPANVLVTPRGAVKLLDFGIAKLLEEGAGAHELTRPGFAALTPQYAAPEQLLGQPVSTATDVYSLGVVLHALLTGSLPIRTGTRSSSDFVHAVLTETPPLASSVAELATVPRKALQGDLNNILQKALKKDPQDRYTSVGAFADDLRRHLSDQPVHARPDTLTYRTHKFVRRHRSGVTVVILSVLGIVAGLVGMAWQAHRAEINAELAERARVQSVLQLGYAEASTELLGFLLGQGAEKPFTTPDLLARGEAIVAGQFMGDPGLQARLLLTLADLYAEVEQKAKARELLAAARAAAAGTHDAALSADIDCTLAMEEADQNEFENSLARLDDAVARLRANPDVEPMALVGCLDKRAQVYRAQGDAVASKHDAETALALLGTPRAGQLTLALSARTTLASANAVLGDAAASVQEYEESIEQLRRMGRGHSDFAVTLLNSMGVILAKSGQWLRASGVYEQALSVARGLSGGAEISPMSEINYAKLLVDLGRIPEALPLFAEAQRAATRRGDVDAQEMIDLLSARAYCESGQVEQCTRHLTSSGVALRQQRPPHHVTLGTQETEEAQLAVAQGNDTLAREHLSKALEIFAAARERNPNELRALSLMAEVALRLRDRPEALRYAGLALEKSRAALGGFTASVWVGRALLAQARVLAADGQADGATRALRQATEILVATAGASAPWTLQTRPLLPGGAGI